MDEAKFFSEINPATLYLLGLYAEENKMSRADAAALILRDYLYANPPAGLNTDPDLMVPLYGLSVDPNHGLDRENIDEDSDEL